MSALDKAEWPAVLQTYSEVLGVFVGGCVGGRRSFHAKAHAHSRGAFKGWLCVLKAERLKDQPLVIHELAHLLVPGGHTDSWRRAVIALGGTLDSTDSMKDYHKRARFLGHFKGLGRRHLSECPCGRQP